MKQSIYIPPIRAANIKNDTNRDYPCQSSSSILRWPKQVEVNLIDILLWIFSIVDIVGWRSNQIILVYPRCNGIFRGKCSKPWSLSSTESILKGCSNNIAIDPQICDAGLDGWYELHRHIEIRRLRARVLK